MTVSSLAKELAKLKSYNYFVAYLDILGATKYMEDDSEQFLNDLNAIHESALIDVQFTNVVTMKDIIIKIFSDNILIAVKTSKNDINREEKLEKIVNLAGNIYCNALSYGYLIRGGITEGKFHHNKTFVYGKALVEAVNIEEAIAIYPRIIIKDNLANLIQQYVMQDNDGQYYLNSFIFTGLKPNITYKLNILDQFKKYNKTDKIKQKIMWLVNYFNSFQESLLNRSLERVEITQQEINQILDEVNNQNVEVYSE